MIPPAERKRMPGKVQIMSNRPTQEDWTKPAAMAIPEGGYFKDKSEQGRYGPIFPKTPGVLRLLRHCKSHPRKGTDHSQPGQDGASTRMSRHGEPL